MRGCPAASGRALLSERVERDPLGAGLRRSEATPAQAAGRGAALASQGGACHLIQAALDDIPDITLPELKARLASQGSHVSVAALWPFCRRYSITRKKTAHATEQSRPDILKQRERWFQEQLDLKPHT
jgi:hypothetical protein